MYYEASQPLDKTPTDYKLPPTEQKKFDEEKTTAENGIKSVKITDALKNVETIYNGGDYDKATEELSKIDTSNLTDAQSQKYQSLQTNIANAKAAAEKAAAEAKAKAKIDISMAKSKVIGTSGYPYASLLAENDEKWYFAPTDEPDANVRDSGGHVSKGVMVYSVDKNTGKVTEKNENPVLKIAKRKEQIDSRVQLVADYVVLHPREKYTPQKMAEMVELSKQRFSSLFKANMGKSPMEYVREIRLTTAARALLVSNKNINDIAYECGYEDANYFIREFKSAFGFTPNQYRKIARE